MPLQEKQQVAEAIRVKLERIDTARRCAGLSLEQIAALSAEYAEAVREQGLATNDILRAVSDPRQMRKRESHGTKY